MEIFKKKPRYYNGDNLLKQQALWNLVWGGRFRGKSYYYKHLVCEEAYKYDYKFGLVLRFYQDRSRIKEMENYFDEVDVKKITDNKYDCIICYSEFFYFGKTDSKGRRKKCVEIGKMLFLDSYESYKSMVFNNYMNMLFEEFITKGRYYHDEVYALENLTATIFRDRVDSGKCKIIMLGNPMTQVIPYAQAFGIENWYNQEPDTIDIYYHNSTVDEFKIKVAVERVSDGEIPGAAITKKGQQGIKGEWETDNLPKITTQELEKYDEKYRFIFTYMGTTFLCKLYSKNNDIFIYVLPYNGKINESWRVIGDIDSTSIYYTKNFTPLIQKENIIFTLIKQKKCYFPTDLIGTNFYTAYNSIIKNNK